MSFTAAFVEYVVNGCTALLWVLVLMCSDQDHPTTSLSQATVLLLLPVLYSVGMLVDFISYWTVKFLEKRYFALPPRLRFKYLRLPKEEAMQEKPKRIRDIVAKPFAIPENDQTISLTIAILADNAEVGRELIVRNSRDRIARGTFLNMLFLSLALILRVFIAVIVGPVQEWFLFWILCIPASLGVALLSFFAWMRFEYLTQRFKYNAYNRLRKSPKALQTRAAALEA